MLLKYTNDPISRTERRVFSSLPLYIKAGLQLYFFLPTTKVFSVMFTFPNFLKMLKDSDLVYTPF